MTGIAREAKLERWGICRDRQSSLESHAGGQSFDRVQRSGKFVQSRVAVQSVQANEDVRRLRQASPRVEHFHLERAIDGSEGKFHLIERVCWVIDGEFALHIGQPGQSLAAGVDLVEFK